MLDRMRRALGRATDRSQVSDPVDTGHTNPALSTTATAAGSESNPDRTFVLEARHEAGLDRRFHSASIGPTTSTATAADGQVAQLRPRFATHIINEHLQKQY